jgi:membrane protein
MNFLGKYAEFIKELVKECGENRIGELAVVLTYRLLFACVPFLIFLMSVIGSLSIDAGYAAKALGGALPEHAAAALSLFLSAAVRESKSGVISISLFVSVFSAAGGFRAIIRGVNGAYKIKEARGFVKLRLVAALLVVVLALAVISTMLLFIFGDKIYAALPPDLRGAPALKPLVGFAGGVVSMAVLLFAIILIYRLSLSGRQTVKDTLPGAAFVVGFWMLVSKVFNIYVNNFSRYSSLYGGVASVFIFMLWLNAVSNAILVGAQINALLFRREVV